MGVSLEACVGLQFQYNLEFIVLHVYTNVPIDDFGVISPTSCVCMASSFMSAHRLQYWDLLSGIAIPTRHPVRR